MPGTPASQKPAPQPSASASGARPALRVSAPAPAAKPASRPVSAPATTAPPAPRVATGSGSASSRSGWMVDWTRPGEMTENHLWKVPVYDTREAPRRFLGITFGTRREKYVERYEDKVEVRGTFVAGHRSAITALAFTGDGRLLASGSRDGTLRVWYVQSGREACAHPETRPAVQSLALVPGRSMPAAGLADPRARAWGFGVRRPGDPP